MLCYRALVLILVTGAALAEPRQVIEPRDTGEALINPCMGWVFHHFDNTIVNYGTPLGTAYAGDGFPGLSTVYLRLPWKYLEPEEGRFNWSVVDTVAQRYIDNGKQVAFLFSCSESHSARVAIPQWVRDAGAKGYWWTFEEGVVENGDNPDAVWEPDYEDPVFLEKLDNFLAAAAARYDGDPTVAFIDIGSFGLWGEGHTAGSHVPYGSEAAKRHIDLHAKHFKKTLIVAEDDFPGQPAGDAIFYPGERESGFVLNIPKGLRNTQYDVYVGLWDPSSEQRYPLNRFIPARGDNERRVHLGVLTIDENGLVAFKNIERSGKVATAADFRALIGTMVSVERPYRLKMQWDILRRLSPSTEGFLHLVQNGKLVAGGWSKPLKSDAVDYARSLGMTLRDNSILAHDTPDAYIHDQMAAPFWPNLPVILESDHYGSARDQGRWGDGSGYLEAMEAYHASYLSIHWFPDEFYRENKELVNRINQRMGYRLQLVKASWPQTVRQDGEITFLGQWRNAGVAPCYPGGYPAVTLKNHKGDIVAVLVDETFNMRALPVGKPGAAPAQPQSAAFLLPPHLQPGQYDLFVSVGSRTGTPKLALPYPNDDGHRRYKMGSVSIAATPGDFGVAAGQPVFENGTFTLPLTCTIRKTLPDGIVPFGHLVREGRIVGNFSLGEVQPETFKDPGTVQLTASLDVPSGISNEVVLMKFGLYQPGNRDRLPSNGRLLPDGAPIDRCVTLGTLKATQNGGTVTFVKSQ